MRMRLLLLSLLSLGCFAQTVAPGASQTTITTTCDSTGKCTGTETKATTTPANTSFFGIGITSTPSGAPAVNLAAMYAHPLSGALYSYTEGLITHIQRSPFSLETSMMTGIADHLFKIGTHADFYAFAEAGSSSTGIATGYAASGGGAVRYKPWAAKEWSVILAAQPLKSSIGGVTEVFTIMVGK